MGQRENILEKRPCIYYFAKGRRQKNRKAGFDNLQNKGKIFGKQGKEANAVGRKAGGDLLL